MYETVQALRQARHFFDCFLKEIQTDNGLEFAEQVRRKPDGKTTSSYDNYLESFSVFNNIKHHLIRPRTPEHNEKAERRHRIN